MTDIFDTLLGEYKKGQSFLDKQGVRWKRTGPDAWRSSEGESLDTESLAELLEEQRDNYKELDFG